MKRLLILVLSLVPALASGQFITFPSRRSVSDENQRLKAKIDSLQAVIDSLTVVSDEMVGALEFEPETPIERSQELTDSLVASWYEGRREARYEEGREYDMDSVVFTSNVSDEELIRRLSRMNSFITLPFNATVKNYMVYYSEKMPQRLSTLLGEAMHYFPIFEEAFDRYGVPLELKYLAIVESMLNPTATSRVGAKGMWQFMYQTAVSYGLKVNSFMDERMDVEKAADAAARYFRDAYNVFGDWPLAISSYNCGAGNVRKAMVRSGSSDFWSVYPFLPKETRGYVPAFVGVMYAMNYYKEYGIVPGPCPIPAQIDTFEVRRNLHFQQINELVGVPMDELKTLNPQYTHDIVPGNEGMCVLRIPYNYTNAFLGIPVDSIAAYKGDKLLNEQVLKNIKASGSETRIAYRVKKGDVLGRIAINNRCTVAQIKRWNNLKSDRIRVGQVLYIYR